MKMFYGKLEKNEYDRKAGEVVRRLRGKETRLLREQV